MSARARSLRSAFVVSWIALVVAGAPVAAQQTCPRASGADDAAGWTAYHDEHLDQARQRFESALKRCPDDQNARTGLGYVALRRGDTAQAGALLHEVVAAEPDNVDALVGLGLLAWRAGDLAAVRRRFEKVEKLSPGNATAREYLARLPKGSASEPAHPPLVAAGSRSAAPASSSGADSAQAAWKRGDHARALRLYQARLKKDPDEPTALHRVALMLAWKQDYGRSLKLLHRLVELQPQDVDAQVDQARVRAWSGDVSGAITELDSLLVRHPRHPGALQARALFEAWAGNYQASLSGYNQLLAISPDNGAARREQAQVLSWASRYGASRAVYDSLLTANPNDAQARLGLARVLTLSNHLDEAIAEYHRLLAADPHNVAALRGLGQALSWAGRLVAGERVYRRAATDDPKDVATLVGLAQNLRWQGRNAAALKTLEGAEKIAPDNSDVHEQLISLHATLGPQAHPSVVVEHDSDGNRMVTSTLVGQWHPVPRLGLRADYYERGLSQHALSRSAWGLNVTGSWVFRPGWTASGGLGGSRNNGPALHSFASLHLGVASPGRYLYGGSLTWDAHAMDATALMAEHGVRLNELALTGRWAPAPGWRVNASLGRAVFYGSQRNQRGNGSLAVSRRLTHFVTLGADVRAFGFQKYLHDGYFDPNFYGIAEVTGRWLYEPGHWSFLLEAAPGVQKVTKTGSPTGAYRVSTRLGYRFAPGREISLAGGYSSTGLQSFSSGAAGYRYTAVILGASWVF